jgi:pilus assembly protein CpaE
VSAGQFSQEVIVLEQLAVTAPGPLADARLRVAVLGDDTPTGAAFGRLVGGDGMEAVGGVRLSAAAVSQVRALRPDVVVVPVDEPLALPLATISGLAQGSPGWTVVALITRAAPELFRKAALAGARDVLVRPSDAASARQALLVARRADLARRPAGSGRPGESGVVVCVSGAKGGVGKTTLAVNLAVTLARDTARSVVLVDLDLPYGDVAMLLDLHPSHDVTTAADPAVARDPERLLAQLSRGPSGVRVLPAPFAPHQLGALPGEQAAELLRRLAGLHDFVVVDTPPGVGELGAAALDVADRVLAVATPEEACLARTAVWLRWLARGGIPAERVELVLNRADARGALPPAAVEARLGHPVAWRVANDRAAIVATVVGRPVAEDRPQSRLAVDARAIARGLTVRAAA